MLNPITPQQIKIIHTLLNKIGIMRDKKFLVNHWTDGRTESTKGMTTIEARKFIDSLKRNKPFDVMRKKIIAIAYDIGMIYGNSDEDKKMNMAKIDSFLKARGTVKKTLNNLDFYELLKVVNQFVQMSKSTEKRSSIKS